VSGRQVETILNEDLGIGWEIPDQQVQLKNIPLFEEESGNQSRLCIGDILDWGKFLQLMLGSSESTCSGKLWGMLSKPVKDRIRQIEEESRSCDSQYLGRSLDDKDKFFIVEECNRYLENSHLIDSEAARNVELPPWSQHLLKKFRNGVASSEEKQLLNRLAFKIEFPGVLLSNRLVVELQEEGNWRPWVITEESLGEAGPDDRYVILDRSEGILTFGNGLNGRIPETGQPIRARVYHHSDGAKGNLPAGKKWNIRPPTGATLPGENLTPAHGGADPESIEELKLRAQADLHLRQRGVTGEDIEKLASTTPGLRVARAIAFPNVHPEISDQIRVPGHTTVVVIPFQREPLTLDEEGSNRPRPPEPTREFLETVQRHLENHRLLGTTVSVTKPVFIPVQVTATIHLKKNAVLAEVQFLATREINNFLDPLTGGPEEKPGWPLGRNVFPSEVYQVLNKVPGVNYVESVIVVNQETEGPLTIPRFGLPYAGNASFVFQPFGRIEGNTTANTGRLAN
jgi:hypothetical protein